MRLRVLYIGCPWDIHDLKWMSFFSSDRVEAYLAYSKEEEKLITQDHIAFHKINNIKLVYGFRPFSITKPVRTYLQIQKLKSLIDLYHIDFVHVFFGTHLYAQFLKVPYLITTRGTDVFKMIPEFASKPLTGQVWKFLYQRSFEKAKYITCTSFGQSDMILLKLKYKCSPKIIRTGIDVLKVSNSTPSKELIEQIEGEKIIFSPRYISPIYGIELIAKGIAELPLKTRKEFTFVFIRNAWSDANYEKTVMSTLDDNGIRYQVFNELIQSDFFYLLKISKLVIMTPISDGTPNTALEAMAVGCPVILGNLDYDKDIFENVCFIMNSRNPNELSELIQKVLEFPPTEMIEKAKIRVGQKGNREVEMTKLMDIYKLINPNSFE